MPRCGVQTMLHVFVVRACQLVLVVKQCSTSRRVPTSHHCSISTSLRRTVKLTWLDCVPATSCYRLTSLLTLHRQLLGLSQRSENYCSLLFQPVLRIATAGRQHAFHRQILVHVINWYTFTIHHFFTIYFWLNTHSSTNNIIIIK